MFSLTQYRKKAMALGTDICTRSIKKSLTAAHKCVARKGTEPKNPSDRRTVIDTSTQDPPSFLPPPPRRYARYIGRYS